MEEFYKKQKLNYAMCAANILFDILIYLTTDYFSTKLIVTWIMFCVIILLGTYFSTPTRNISGSICSVSLALILPITAAVDPSSRYIAEIFNSIAVFAGYIMSEVEHLDLRITVLNLSAWSIYWLFNKDLVCTSSNQSECLEFKTIMLQFVSNALMAINIYFYVKHKETLIQKQKEAQKQIVEHLQTQEKLNAELKRTMEMNDNFLMAFSHELKNPLNALLGSIELAEGENVSEEVRSLLTNANNSGQMLLHLLTNILDSGKVQLNKLDVNLQPGNFTEYIENFWLNASKLIKAKGLRGSLIMKKSFPSRVLFDNHRLSQILLNLLSNALKFTQRGQIKMIFSFEPATELPTTKLESEHLLSTFIEDAELLQGQKHTPRILNLSPNPLDLWSAPQERELNGSECLGEVFQLDFIRRHFPISYFQPQHQSKEGYIRIEIVDTGCGMSSNQMQHLFNRFSQVSENTSQRQMGTGLGLWISKELCRLMNGDIHVSSREGVGTSFVVLIKSQSYPDANDELLSQKNRSARNSIQKSRIIEEINEDRRLQSQPTDQTIYTLSSKLPAPNKKVLVAEDLVYNQEIYKRMLKKEQADVFIAKDGAEAVKLFKQAPPGFFQLLLFDLNMPELDGISASKMIREHESSNSLKKSHIIIVTGHCTKEIKQVCLDQEGAVRAHDVLTKPLTQTDFHRICQLTNK